MLKANIVDCNENRGSHTIMKYLEGENMCLR